MKTLGRELAAFGFFLLLAILFTWPLAIRLSTGTSDLADPLLNTWIINWDLYDATHHVANIYQAPMFYPAKYPLAYSENLFGIAILALPFYLAGCTPLTIYNIMFIGGFAFCGYGAWVLVRQLTRSWAAALVAGVLYAFVPFRFDHMPHIQLIWGGWLPLILAALLHYWRRSSWASAAAFGGALLINGLTNIHYFLFGTLTAAITVFVLAVVDRRIDWRFWLRLVVVVGIFLGVMLPVLLPYKTVSQLYHMKRQPAEAEWGSATWSDWLMPTFASRTYGDLIPSEKTQPERHLFPGLFVLFLTAAAFALGMSDSGAENSGPPPADNRTRWLLRILDVAIVGFAVVSYWGTVSPKFILRVFGIRILSVSSSDLPVTFLLIAIFIRLWLRRPQAWRGGLRLPLPFWIGCLWIGIGILGSFGLNGFFHTLLYNRIEAFQAVRVPARWATIAYVGLAVTAGFGALALMRRRRHWQIAFVVLLAIAIFDMRPRVRWEHAITEIDPVYRWIAETPYRGALLELPVQEERVEWLYLLSQTFHHRTMLNGTSGFDPPVDLRLRDLTLKKQWTSELTAEIAKAGCSIIIVHDDWLREQSDRAHAWIRSELASGRLIFLRKFDHRVGGDFVFAVAATCPDCARFRWPEQQQYLDRALNGEPVYLARTFGTMDFPRDENIATRSLTVSGWALSPWGIEHVDVLLNSGTTRYRAEMTDRGDVQARFPWYARVRHAGFAITIPKRPHAVPKHTDVQVEIVDGRGAKTRLPDLFIEWP